MDDRKVVEDEDRDVLSALGNAPPAAKKIHSQSQHIRGTASVSSKRTQRRKHSLDENHLPKVDQLYDSSDENFIPYSSSSAAAALGHVTDASSLQQRKSDPADDPQPLPEFVASGGGVGIFKVPNRASVHPARPPFIELRPHPLKETQVGKFLRNLACTGTQLWAGQESGVRFWNLGSTFDAGWGHSGRVRRGDEDAAPFHESVTTSPTTCLLVDEANRLVWTGHKDGKIRSWKMDQPLDDNPFKEGLCWQAHRGPILSMIMTSYGDLWSGSEGGIIRIWPWETIEKSLSLSTEEKHMAALLVERAFIDLKSQVTVNSSCSIPSAEVKCLLSDNCRGKVWAATPLIFSLWNARTRELLKVFNIEGQIENKVDAAQSQQSQEQPVEDEMKVKFVSSSKKEKPQGLLQRSRNAIMGAADAVRRVATKGTGAFGDDNKKTEALVLAPDGTIWSGCSNGLLIQWDGNGNRLQDINHMSCAVLCFCTFGTRIYVGYISGFLQVLDLEGTVIAGWVAHTSPVIKLAVGGSEYIYSLATHGGIRGWFVASPGPIDGIVRSELASRVQAYTRQNNIKILVGTWNVGQGRASQEALVAWLGSAASDVGIVVAGCQEVDMGAGFLAMSAAKETVGLEGSAAGNWWVDTIGKSLDEGNTFERMGSRQLAGLLIAFWVRKNLRTHAGDVDVAAVPCGFGRAIGNKGGVGLRIRVYDRIICFVNCHLAAHLEAVNRRNADFDHIYRTMAFSRSYNVLNAAAAAGVSASAQMPRSSSNGGKDKDKEKDKDKDKDKEKDAEEARPDLSEADMVVFLGDFNYRLFGMTYDEARDFVSQRCFDWLRERDQLRAEMKAGKVFQGMHEALIRFPPTYKFERHKPGLGGYDSGEKKRIPAWCDRVLYRDSRSSIASECSLRCPVVASVLMYEACMDVTESDHKPVRCKYSVDIAHVDRSVRRVEFGKVLKSNDSIRSVLAELHQVPETAISTNTIHLKNQDTSVLRITNKSLKEVVVFRFICDGISSVKEDAGSSDLHARGSFGFPRWLEVTPAVGVLQPEQSLEVSVHHEENGTEDSVDCIPQNWWSEDTRDKEVVLSLIIQGSCTTERISHQIHVFHSFTGKTILSPTTDSSKGSTTNNSSKINQSSSGSTGKSNQSSSGSTGKSNQASSGSTGKSNQASSGSTGKSNQTSSGSASKSNQAGSVSGSSLSSKSNQADSVSGSSSSSKNSPLGSGSSSKNSQSGSGSSSKNSQSGSGSSSKNSQSGSGSSSKNSQSGSGSSSKNNQLGSGSSSKKSQSGSSSKNNQSDSSSKTSQTGLGQNNNSNQTSSGLSSKTNKASSDSSSKTSKASSGSSSKNNQAGSGSSWTQRVDNK